MRLCIGLTDRWEIFNKILSVEKSDFRYKKITIAEKEAEPNLLLTEKLPKI